MRKRAALSLVLFFSMLSFAQNVVIDQYFTTLDRASDQTNNEINCYKPYNTSITGGLLTLTFKSDANVTCPWVYAGDSGSNVNGCTPTASVSGTSQTCTFQKSASMIQYTSKTFQYGELQIRAKVAGTGTWPAIWLLGSNCQNVNLTTADNLSPCHWPSTGSMEIDIAEWLAADGRTFVRQNVFTSGGVENGCTPTISDASANFHVYGIRRTNAPQVQLLVDGVVSCTFTGANASTDAMFLMINIAQAASTSPSNTSTIVDWVKECDGNGVTCDNGITGAAAGNMGTGFFDDFTSTVTAYGVNIPTNHPRLLWDAAHISRLNTWWATHSFTPSGSDQFAMMDFLLAYQATGNASYCTTAINSALAQNLSSCTPTTAGCDVARWWGEVSILAYDWCYNVMTPTQRSTMLSNWNTWLTNISQESWGGVGSSQSNFYSGYMRDFMEWGISTYPENATTADALLKNGIQTRYQNDFTPASTTIGQGAGGVQLEGGEYGPYFGYYQSTVIMPAITANGRSIWNETSYWKGTVFEYIYGTPPQQTVSAAKSTGWDLFTFSDDQSWGNGGEASASYVGNYMVQAANVWSSINIGQYAKQWVNSVAPSVDRIVQAQDISSTAISFSSLPLDYYAPGPKYMYGRSDWTTNATAYQWMMGDHYSDGHNHSDWGSFQIHRKGRWLTRETVGYADTIAGYGGIGLQGSNLDVAHNLPLVNGAGGVNATGIGNWNSSPAINRLESQPGYAYADVDLTGVYRNDICCAGHPERGNLAAVHVEREYIFIRDIETFVILDRIQSDTSARSKTFVLHCETNPTMVDANHFKCVNGTQQLYTTTLLPTSPSSRTVVNEHNNSATNSLQTVQYRVEVNDLPGVTTSYTLHTMQAMDTSGTLLSPSVVDSSPGTPLSGTFTVTIDANHSIVFNKGMTSSGGSITINGSGTGFRSSVQAMTITDAGPVWAGAQTPPPPSPANMFTFVRKETWPTSR